LQVDLKKQPLSNMKTIAFYFFVLTTFFAFSQKQVEVSLELLDGNIIKGTSLISDIDLQTAYGKLQIPVSKVSHIDVGIGKDDALNQKALSSLKLLATSTNEANRKAAYSELMKMGVKVIPTMEEFYSTPKNTSDQNLESSEYTVENCLTEMKSLNNLSENMRIDDVLSIDDGYTMGGLYNFAKMEVKTDYGTLSIPKEKIKSIDIAISIEPGSGEFSFKLLASKHISGNTTGGWLKTGISLKAGQRFSISANGEVTLASLSNTKYKPDGSSKAETTAEFTKAYGEEDAAYATTYPSYGQVVYKIGDASTENLKAGAKFNGVAKTSGMLLISIYETVYNAANKGSYNVKISLGK
jgi:hypothetical protein